MKIHIKSLFENFSNKFSASYITYRKQNYPNAWAAASISYAENFEHQYIKLLYKEAEYTYYALIFEHEGSIYTVNDKALALASASRRPADLALAFASPYWHRHNYLFKLSISDFEIACSAAKDYEEFILMCEQVDNDESYKASFYGLLKILIETRAIK